MECTNGARDVLDLHLALVFQREIELAADLVPDISAYADATRLGERLQSGRDVHSIAIDVATVDDDIADVDADAEVDCLVLGYIAIAPAHIQLDKDRTRHGVDDAGELHEHTVAHELDDVAIVLCDLDVDEIAPMSLQGIERACLIGAHEPAVANNISRKNRSQPSFHHISLGAAV